MSITIKTLQFLQDLHSNNNRSWFNDHKDRYSEAIEEFEQFIGDLIINIADFDPSIAHHRAKDCIFRIYRDIRFSKDKSPYKTHLGAHITAAAKKSEIHSRAGYYIQIAPGDSMLAGGAYLPQGEWLKAIRSKIDRDANELRKILDEESFRHFFGEMEGEKLKTSPKGYPKDHPEIELLRYKSFLATHRCSNEVVQSDDFLSHCTQVFRTLHPFDTFLNSASK